MTPAENSATRPFPARGRAVEAPREVVPRRRWERVLRAVERAARARPAPAGALRPVDLEGWRRTLAAALARAPELPPRAWAAALTGAWRLEARERGGMVRALASCPVALCDLAAIVAKHDVGGARLSPRARRRVAEVLAALSRACAERLARGG